MTDWEALAALRLWYPGAVIWQGGATGKWWAMPAGSNRLIEGRDAGDIGRKLAETAAATARTDGRWSR